MHRFQASTLSANRTVKGPLSACLNNNANNNNRTRRRVGD